MNPRLAVTAVVAAATIATGPSAFAAPTIVHFSHKPPLSGQWNATSPASDLQVSKGSFTVTAHHRNVTKLSLTLGSAAESACGTGTIKVVGPQKIFLSKTSRTQGQFLGWVVGVTNPKKSPSLQNKPVTLSRNGKKFKGALSLDWIKPNGSGAYQTGILTFGKGFAHQCNVTFPMRKA